jgi:hypothetical protein
MNLQQTATCADSAQCVTVLVQNNSSTTIFLSSATLTGGSWCEGGQPVVGQSTIAGQSVTVQNCGANPFLILGGNVVFSPVTGGQIIANWGWPDNQGLFQSCTSSASPLQVNSWINNPATSTPTIMVVITPV